MDCVGNDFFVNQLERIFEETEQAQAGEGEPFFCEAGRQSTARQPRRLKASCRTKESNAVREYVYECVGSTLLLIQ